MTEFNPQDRKLLLQTAKESIAYSLHNSGKIMSVQLQNFPEHLQQQRACFVTLHLNNKLRGCIGSLQAHQPLIIDVIYNASNSALHDPRFTPVTLQEYPHLQLDISILSQPSTMYFTSEDDLLAQLQPGIDGLILSDLGRRATFLPSVWEQLADKKEFLAHLKAKAGLPTTYWSETIKIEKYHAELIS